MVNYFSELMLVENNGKVSKLTKLFFFFGHFCCIPCNYFFVLSRFRDGIVPENFLGGLRMPAFLFVFLAIREFRGWPPSENLNRFKRERVLATFKQRLLGNAQRT